MKRNLLILFLLVHSVFGFAQDRSVTLLAHYPLHGNANDISGNGNNGSIVGNLSAADGPDGSSGTAMYFNGDSYIEVPASSSTNNIGESMSISYWVKTESFYGGAWSSVVCKADGGEAHYRLGVGANNAYLAFKGGLGWNLSYPYAIEDGWVFVAATYADNIARFYKNGAFVSEVALTPTNYFDESAPLYIGYDPALGADYLIGWASDVRIYAGALSDEEVISVYQGFDPSGIFDFSSNKVQLLVSPNPVTDYCTLSLEGHFDLYQPTLLKITDITGQLLRSVFLQQENRVDVSFLKPGTYLMQVIQQDKVAVATIVKK